MLADSDLTNALSNIQRVAQDTPSPVQKYLYRTIRYVGGTTVMKNGFNREVLNAYDQSYGYPLSPEEAGNLCTSNDSFRCMGKLIRAVDAMSITQKQEDRWQYWLAACL